MPMHEILLLCLGWCPKLLLGIVRQATKMDMQDCWSFTCCFSWNLGSLWKCSQLKIFYRHYFGRCSSEPFQLVPCAVSQGGSTRYCDRLHHFSFTIPRYFKDVYVNSFFPCTARLRISLPIECFPLTYNPNGFKSRINRQLLKVGSF